MKSLRLLIVLLFLSLTIVTDSFSQRNDGTNCKSKVDGGKYKSASIGPLMDSPKSYFGYILIRPSEVSKEFLLKLATRLKVEYCNAEKLQVVIFDKKEYANSNSLRDYAASKGKIILMRGFYNFDTITGVDALEFSTKFGNPTTEVQLDLTKDKHSRRNCDQKEL